MASMAPLTHWGQLVCGPPGSGKTTYCAAMHEFLNNAGRPTVIVNLDPANERTPYPAAISLSELISVEDAAEAYGLGPNGGLMYCLEFLEANLDWLEERLRALQGYYFIFDCPGQAELYTHHASFFKIVQALQKRLDFRLASVHLVDAHYCSDPTKFIAAALLSLTAMIRLELPHVNVLSKLDLVKAYGQPAFGLDFYTEAHDLHRLTDLIGDESAIGRVRRRINAGPDGPAGADGSEHSDDDDGGSDDGGSDAGAADFEREARQAPASGSGREAGVCESASPAASSAATAAAGPAGVGSDALRRRIRRATEARRRAFVAKHRRLNARLAEVVEEYSLLSFIPVTVREPESLLRLVKVVDKSHGFVPIHAGSAAAGGRPAVPLSAGMSGGGASGGGGGSGGTPAWMPRVPAHMQQAGSRGAVAADGSTVYNSTGAAGSGGGGDSEHDASSFASGVGGGGGGGDAIAEMEMGEWDFERLSGFEEKYLQRFGAELYGMDDVSAGADDEASGSSTGGAGRGGGAAGGRRKPRSLKSGRVQEHEVASSASAAAPAAPPVLVGGRLVPAGAAQGALAVEGFGAEEEALEQIPGLQPAGAAAEAAALAATRR